jgi:hypothetical protein
LLAQGPRPQLNSTLYGQMLLKRSRVLALVATLCVCAACGETSASIVGELQVVEGQWLVTPCDSETTYWVRALASNLYFGLYTRVRELQDQDPRAPIIVEMEGTIQDQAGSSRGNVAPHDYVLVLSSLKSIKHGSCSPDGSPHADVPYNRQLKQTVTSLACARAAPAA